MQQIDKYHDLFTISLARGFSEPDYEQNTHTLDTICTYLVSKYINVKYGRFGCLNYHTELFKNPRDVSNLLRSHPIVCHSHLFYMNIY